MTRPEKHWRLGYTSDFDLDSYWASCAISDVTVPEFLRASHIKPWRDSSNQERLDPFNGILLNAALDIAFELGFISFNDDGAILIGRL